LPSQFDEDGMTYDEAYDFQEALVAQLEAEGAQQVGYKLGLTGPKRPFGAEEPLYGRLLDFMVLENGAQVPAGDFVKPLGEWEIAYFFDKDVSYPVTVEELQDAVGQIAPAVELPDLVFADMKSLTWLDLIASDIAPRRVVIGDKISDEDVDENAVTVVATMDGEVVGEGVGSAVMGDQWEALRFLAEKLNERGEQIHAGDFVISGAMNPLTPLGPGSYTVDYGPFGVITFEISE
jgi:2-keto-4-pentenoate hydratase